MQIKIYRGSQVRKTRALYEEVFQDPEAYTNFFYERAQREATVFCIEEAGEIVAEAFVFPKKLCRGDTEYKGAYLYGVATKQEYRHRGLMRHLLAYIENEVQECFGWLFLIPVDERIYLPFGYRNVAKEEHVMLCAAEEEIREQKMLLTDVCATYAEEIAFLQRKIFRDAWYLKKDAGEWEQREALARLEGGHCYLFVEQDTRRLTGLLITSAEEEALEIIEIIGENKVEMAQSIMRKCGKKQAMLRKCPLMIKNLQGEEKDWFLARGEIQDEM